MASPYNNLLVKHYYHHPAADTAAVITLAAPGSDLCWVIEDILLGFDNVPVAAKEFSIAFGGEAAIKIPISSNDAKRVAPLGGLRGKANQEIVITLTADTGGAKGYLNAQCRQEHSN